MIIFGAKYLFLFIIAILVILIIRQKRDKQKEIIFLSIIYLPVVYIIAKISSAFIYTERPFSVGHFQPLIPHLPDNGFPSDHMLICSAVASIIFYYDKRLGILAWILAFFVGFSRVSAGVHHWVDIIGSASIAIVVMILYKYLIMPNILKTKIYQKVIVKKINIS